MKKVVFFAVLLISCAMSAQKVKVLSGNLKNLKGISEYNLTFDYKDIKVDKFKTEEEFLADKMKKREEKGTDEDFRKSWFADREDRYEPKFIESFNKRFENGEIRVGKELSNAKYTMNVKTVWISPGFNVGVVRRDAYVTGIVTVFETANPSNVLVSIEYEKTHGEGAMGFDFNSGHRISEGYAKMAKELAQGIKKNTK
ncbi:MAG: hypothetical protein CVU07_06670 [Bacteroidetes bacterium HGW-Bacteroidetes-23]|uniref:DUF4410 domain-containing protein n=1 Tax=Flavobacterium azooxidireducens TaxID=1871076 RepID=A0ABY4KGZ2_9FLAO|nr:hypothetical protein [Flavobacterium azooxidireducens]PKP16508.1 MAG: hypothetical protein CVU07_06670 [Bacteroidetes bacterium HGW-Bacteroidetes-23]UPQ79939.1 hypothetical protein M0M57_03670 [Flavobacterium azooxidireducens]